MPKKMNWSQVRDATDSGKTRDKVNFPDPAAAPLGTDEEAGGASTPTEEIAKSVNEREHDIERPSPADEKSEVPEGNETDRNARRKPGKD